MSHNTKRYNNFNPNTAETVLKTLPLLRGIVLEHKIAILQSTIGIDQKLVTKNVDDDLYVIDYLMGEIKKSSFYLNLEDNDPQYLKAALLFYKLKLLQAKKIANNSELDREIKEVERILELELVKNATNDVYERYANPTSSTTKQAVDEVTELINEVENLNVFSKSVLKCKIFQNNAKLLNDLRSITKTPEEFTHRVTTIGSIINDVFYDEIKNTISAKNIDGSINLIQTLLDEKEVNYDKDAIQKLRQLYRLRNTKQPIHNGEHEAIKILDELGIDYPINYIEAGEKLVRHLLEAIKSLSASLGQHAKQN